VYLHDDVIRQLLHQKILGKGTKLNFTEGNNALTITMVDTEPPLETGELGRLSSSKIEFRPTQVFNEFNIIICISASEDLDTRDIDLKTLYSLKQRLNSLTHDTPELEIFLSDLDVTIKRSEAALLLSLQLVHAISVNRTEGKFALLIAGESLTKFTIQRGDTVQSYIEYANDLQSKEVLISLIYTILDSANEITRSGKPTIAFRAIAESLEDLGSDRPTLVILFTSNILNDSEGITPLINAISRNERYHLDVFGLGSDFNPEMTEKILDSLKVSIYPTTKLSAHFFDQYLLNAINRLYSIS
jgi:hypothetical protein